MQHQSDSCSCHDDNLVTASRRTPADASTRDESCIRQKKIRQRISALISDFGFKMSAVNCGACYVVPCPAELRRPEQRDIRRKRAALPSRAERGPMRADCIQPRAVRPAHRTHVDGLNPQRAFAPVCTTTHTAGANGLYWEYYPRFFLSADGTQFYGTMRALRSARLRYCNAGDGFGPQLAFSERLPVVAVRR